MYTLTSTLLERLNDKTQAVLYQIETDDRLNKIPVTLSERIRVSNGQRVLTRRVVALALTLSILVFD